MSRPTTVILGTGNVGTHLCRALSEHTDIIDIWSRSIEHARRLSAEIPGSRPLDKLSDVRTDADFYIIAVADDAVADVAARLPEVNGIVAHTSGSMGLSALTGCKGACKGVFYPLQTFSREREIDLSEVPFFIEGSDRSTTDRLLSLAHTVSRTVREADSRQRGVLHLAAVFACNFANSLWGISDDILREAGYSLEVFGPLLEETLRKAITNGAIESQTGPARRGDQKVIDSHLSKLEGLPREIYRLMTSQIIQQQSAKNEQDRL